MTPSETGRSFAMPARRCCGRISTRSTRKSSEALPTARGRKGAHLDLWDIVALKTRASSCRITTPWLNKQNKTDALRCAAAFPLEGRCSAFIATGSYTKGGKIVIAHNNWSSGADGER